MTVLVTGVAGFIGFHIAKALIARGEQVVGIDNLNDYYDVSLKEARLAQLRDPAFFFAKIDISDRDAVFALVGQYDFRSVIHLAAQAGVRYSMVNPYAYVQSNVMGHVVMLEAAKTMAKLDHFVYASSSSVYGLNRSLPFKETDRVDHPSSLYAATKRADELISHSYAHLYGLPQTGLRFFTVYGPWGRPDMAYFSFAKAIMAGEPITLYEGQNLSRDFTYIDDIVAGVLGALAAKPQSGTNSRILNLGNHTPETIMRLIELLEEALGKRAIILRIARPAADIEVTWADIDQASQVVDFAPKTKFAEGIRKFTDWLATHTYKGFDDQQQNLQTSTN